MTTQYLRLSLDTMLTPDLLCWIQENGWSGSYGYDVYPFSANDVIRGYLFTREGFTQDQAESAMYALW
jgi:hypothetical protein